MNVFLSFLVFLAYVAFPIGFIFRLFRKYYSSFWDWISETSLYITYMLYLFFAGIWNMTYGKTAFYVLSALFLFSYFRSITRLKRPLNFTIYGFRSYLKIGTNFLVLVLFSLQFIYIYKAYQKPDQCVALSFPFKHGTFEVVHGGGHGILNHHYPVYAQRYAMDIVKVNRWGIRGLSWFPKQLQEYLIYDTKIYSPCSGTVVEAKDIYQDQKPGVMDSKNIAGNFIALFNEELNVTIVLAHLKPNSLQVQKGDKILEGQFLAKVGNSGNTSEPHLHIHAVKNKISFDLFSNAEGIPITFQDRFLVRNMSIECRNTDC